MCQANVIGHWLDQAHSPAERQRRLEALRKLGTKHEAPSGAYWEYPGEAVLDLIKGWHTVFYRDEDQSVLVTDGSRLVETSALAARLLVP